MVQLQGYVHTPIAGPLAGCELDYKLSLSDLTGELLAAGPRSVRI